MMNETCGYSTWVKDKDRIYYYVCVLPKDHYGRSHEFKIEGGNLDVVRENKYKVRIGEIHVVANYDTELKIRDMTQAQLSNFVKIMGGGV